ncbi:hypothetical protein Bbelb_105070 [Branchiostoma belcheri]|nr:hypothetical protein Bbelb_105070 [Branchiostoma belcheri]
MAGAVRMESAPQDRLPLDIRHGDGQSFASDVVQWRSERRARKLSGNIANFWRHKSGEEIREGDNVSPKPAPRLSHGIRAIGTIGRRTLRAQRPVPRAPPEMFGKGCNRIICLDARFRIIWLHLPWACVSELGWQRVFLGPSPPPCLHLSTRKAQQAGGGHQWSVKGSAYSTALLAPSILPSPHRNSQATAVNLPARVGYAASSRPMTGAPGSNTIGSPFARTPGYCENGTWRG